MGMSSTEKRLHRSLRRISRRLRIKFDDEIGFNPMGGSDSLVAKSSRTAEFIGFYLMHANQYPPEVKPHLAGMVLRSIACDANHPELTGLITDFLATTRKDWRKAQPVLSSHTMDPVFDFSDAEDPQCTARRDISKALTLRFPAYDWEHCNANASRAAEFVAYCQSVSSSEPERLKGKPYPLLDNALQLMLCSIDRAIGNGTLDAATRNAAQRLIEEQVEPPDERGLCCVRWTPDGKYLRDDSLLDFAWWDRPIGQRQVSAELNLKHPAVDWPSYNAAPSRLIEFLEIYFDGWRQHSHIDRQVALGSLILASMAALLEERSPTAREQEWFGRFVREQRGEQASNLARWATLGSRKLVMLVSDAVLTADDKETRPWDPSIYQCPEVSKHGQGSALHYYANCALELSYAGQDWGIVNGRAERAVEFIRYYLERRERLRPWHGSFEELICASLDDALRRGSLDQETVAAANEFFMASAGNDSSTLDYWAKWWSCRLKPAAEQ